MKLSTLVGLMVLLLTACSKQATNSIDLEGEIKGLGNDTLYIYGTDNLYTHTDTLVANKGKLHATLQSDTLVETCLVFANGDTYPLFLNKGNHIRIKGSAAEIESLEITGNLPNEELSAFQQDIKGLGTPSQQALQEKAEAFITSHPTSMVSIYLLRKYFVETSAPDIEKIKTLIEAMAGELKDRPYIDQLQAVIKEAEKSNIGRSITYFQLPNAEGKSISRSNFKDKYLLIHFWASWDSLSRAKNESLRAIYKEEKKSKLFAMMGVSLDVDSLAWQEAVKADSLEWEQTCNLQGWNTSLVNQFSIRNLPANILLTPYGRIEGRDLDEKAIRQKIEDLKAEEKAKKEEERKRKRKK